MTVNEGLTTDTAMTTDSEQAAETKLNESLAASGVISSDQEKDEEATGILSSDD